jgi:phage terminase large subunit
MASWLESIVARRCEGVLEKSRDVGASWMMALFALHRWLFTPGFRTTFGSYKQEKVDRIGDSDSIFEKLRIAVDMLPQWMMPAGWQKAQHDNYMRLLNPENGNEIVGEVGQQMGRGGRSTWFVVDEAAFVDHLKAAMRAVSANADAKVYASTANGMANSFYVKREATLHRDPTLLFRFHWRDDPRKGDEWAAAKRAEMEPEDWASEHEIDYGASVERQLIKAEWIAACHELAKSRALEATGPIRSGLDLGAGKAESVLVTARGPCVDNVTAWRDPDSVDAASRAVDHARAFGATEVRYDATGVGFAQGSIMSRMNGGVRVLAINVGEPPPSWVRVPESRKGGTTVPASDRFFNLKALGWWQLRERAKTSWELVNGLATPPLSDCLLLAVDDPKLDAQLCQPTWSKNLRGKVQVDKAPEGTKSPDRADAVMLAFVPAQGGTFSTSKLLGV